MADHNLVKLPKLSYQEAPLLRYHLKKLLFTQTAVAAELPSPMRLIMLSLLPPSALILTDTHSILECKLATEEARTALARQMLLGVVEDGVKGMIVELRGAKIEVKGGKVGLKAEQIEVVGVSKEEVVEGERIEEDKEIQTLMRFKQEQIAKEALNTQLTSVEFPLIKTIQAAPAHTPSKTSISTRFSVIELDQRPKQTGFLELTDDEQLIGDDLESSSSKKQKDQFTFKEVLDEFERRVTQKKAEDEDFLNLLQMGGQEDEMSSEEKIEEEDIKDAMIEDDVPIDDVQMDMPNQPSPEELKQKETLQRYEANIGFGVNNSQNQNELRMHKQASLVVPQIIASHPSQGDLLEMIDTSSVPKKKHLFAEPEPRKQQPEFQASAEEVQMNDGVEIHFTKEDYEKWLAKMTVSKYNHYIAWFNINIKQINTQEEEQPKEAVMEPDYRIHVPINPPVQESTANLSVLERLKLTAHRRNAMQGEPPQQQQSPPRHALEKSEVVLHPRDIQQESTLKSGNRLLPLTYQKSHAAQFPKNEVKVVEAAERCGNEKKRTRDEFEGGDNKDAPLRGYKKLRANEI